MRHAGLRYTPGSGRGTAGRAADRSLSRAETRPAARAGVADSWPSTLDADPGRSRRPGGCRPPRSPRATFS